ncbi:MAG: helix-turn-helix transcriptional regulator [Methanobrevibacter sp.]|jgi:transcriptional regulator with XRE-family HTH domain|nr:helix-turn-helix transcriptional regulator [Methanobrevibacter sp.]MEE3443420.1 helix-turn-helix transcriptional regulator [Methanobrevibacter sp.]
MGTVGSRIKELRESKALSQSDLAIYLGISQSLLSQIEAGNRNLNLTLLDKLCSLFGCTNSYILGEDDHYSDIRFAFRSKNAAVEDLDCVAAINKIILNLRFLNKINAEKDYNQ